jgi:hypothetical protein
MANGIPRDTRMTKGGRIQELQVTGGNVCAETDTKGAALRVGNVTNDGQLVWGLEKSSRFERARNPM